MASRSSRSQSIPIPRSAPASSSARSLENLIPLPNVPSPRPRQSSTHSRSPEDRRASNYYGTSNPGTSGHLLSRSYSHASGIPSSASSSGPRRIEPRIIHSISPARTRKPSIPGTRSPATQTSSGSQASSSRATFPRPGYLNHSFLRDMLQTYPSIRNPLLSVAPNGRELTFHGASCSGDKESAAARTNFAIPPACGVYYYEVKILNKGHPGFAGPNVKTSRLPGWEPNSWGFHADDGHVFQQERNGSAYGPSFGTGDVIGCGIDFSSGRAFYTRNGAFLGPVFENVGKNCELYPTIGMRHHGESIFANFGHEPFVYDIDYYVRATRQATWERLMNGPVNARVLNTSRLHDFEDNKDGISHSSRIPPAATDDQSKAFLNGLIGAYLSHHGYSKTLKAFEQQAQTRRIPASQAASTSTNAAVSVAAAPLAGGDGDVDMFDAVIKIEEGTVGPEEEIQLRTKIVQSVVAGDLTTALADTEQHYPSVLTADAGLILFKMRARKFVEMMLEAAELEKRLKDAREELDDGIIDGLMDGVDDEMYVDGVDGTTATTTARLVVPSAPSSSSGATREAMDQALTFGGRLQVDIEKDPRPEVQDIHKQMTSMISGLGFESGGGTNPDVVFGQQQSRIVLAGEVNQAILKSQGRPGVPALEMLFRQTSACVTQLGILGVGTAAFADVHKELLEG
ncbi:hypothetical protein DL96DRAFT_1572181 [Flagelloscypha sp. PMI_526]|nr:hypothetical protein DL96DRAFT_1572181 [Flagelloscypha sp. PMI_526]